MSTEAHHEPNQHAGHRKRLRERYKMAGMEHFAPHEVLELLLTYAIPRIDVNKQAHALVERFGSVGAVLDAPVEELTEVEGIGPEAAQFLHMLPEVFRHYMLSKSDVGEPMNTLSEIGEYLKAIYVGATVERVYLLLFDNGMHLIQCCHIGDGVVNASNITVRKIAELCLRKNTACAVLAHNHPSGMAIPSSADIEVTHAVESALEVVGVPLLEHIIVTEYSYAPILRNRKGLLRSSPVTGTVDENFYLRFYGETSDS